MSFVHIKIQNDNALQYYSTIPLMHVDHYNARLRLLNPPQHYEMT